MREALSGFRVRGALWGLGEGRETLNTGCCWCVPTQGQSVRKEQRDAHKSLVLLHPPNEQTSDTSIFTEINSNAIANRT